MGRGCLETNYVAGLGFGGPLIPERTCQREGLRFPASTPAPRGKVWGWGGWSPLGFRHRAGNKA